MNPAAFILFESCLGLAFHATLSSAPLIQSRATKAEWKPHVESAKKEGAVVVGGLSGSRDAQ